MDPHSPNKLFATKYCFLILGDEFLFLNHFFIFLYFFFSLFFFLLFYVISLLSIFTKTMLLLSFYLIKIFFMKITFIFACSGMFRDVHGCSGMFRDVPCSWFYWRPLHSSFLLSLWLSWRPRAETIAAGRLSMLQRTDLKFSEIQNVFYSSVKPSKHVKKRYLIG